MNTKEVTKDSRIQIRIEKELLDDLKKEAEEEGMTMSEYVINCVDFYRFCLSLGSCYHTITILEEHRRFKVFWHFELILLLP